MLDNTNELHEIEVASEAGDVSWQTLKEKALQVLEYANDEITKENLEALFGKSDEQDWNRVIDECQKIIANRETGKVLSWDQPVELLFLHYVYKYGIGVIKNADQAKSLLGKFEASLPPPEINGKITNAYKSGEKSLFISGLEMTEQAWKVIDKTESGNYHARFAHFLVDFYKKSSGTEFRPYWTDSFPTAYSAEEFNEVWRNIYTSKGTIFSHNKAADDTQHIVTKIKSKCWILSSKEKNLSGTNKGKDSEVWDCLRDAIHSLNISGAVSNQQGEERAFFRLLRKKPDSIEWREYCKLVGFLATQVTPEEEPWKTLVERCRDILGFYAYVDWYLRLDGDAAKFVVGFDSIPKNVTGDSWKRYTIDGEKHVINRLDAWYHQIPWNRSVKVEYGHYSWDTLSHEQGKGKPKRTWESALFDSADKSYGVFVHYHSTKGCEQEKWWKREDSPQIESGQSEFMVCARDTGMINRLRLSAESDALKWEFQKEGFFRISSPESNETARFPYFIYKITDRPKDSDATINLYEQGAQKPDLTISVLPQATDTVRENEPFISCDARWALYENGHTISLILAVENVSPSPSLKDGDGNLKPGSFILSPASDTAGEGASKRKNPKQDFYFKFNEIKRAMDHDGNGAVSLVFLPEDNPDCPHPIQVPAFNGESTFKPKPIFDLCNRLMAGNGTKPLVFEDEGDSSVKWHPLAASCDLSRINDIQTKYAWIVLPNPAPESKNLPELPGLIHPLTVSDGIGCAYKIELPLKPGDTGRIPYCFKGETLFYYQFGAKRTITRDGFSSEVRIEKGEWRVFTGSNCLLRREDGEDDYANEEWSATLAQPGLTVDGRTCKIRPDNPDTFSDYTVVNSGKSKERILYFPSSVLREIQEGRMEGDGWKFVPNDNGLSPLRREIARAQAGEVCGRLQYGADVHGDNARELPVTISLPLTKHVFWFERDYFSFDDDEMEESDVKLGKTFESYDSLGTWYDDLGKLHKDSGKWYICSKAREEAIIEVWRTTNGTRVKLKEISLPDVGQTLIASLVRDVPEWDSDSTDAYRHGDTLLFSVKCRKLAPQLFRCTGDGKKWYGLFPRGNYSLVLFTENLLVDDRDGKEIKVIPSPVSTGKVPLSDFFDAGWGDIPVYATIVTDRQPEGHGHWLDTLADHLADFTCVNEAEFESKLIFKAKLELEKRGMQPQNENAVFYPTWKQIRSSQWNKYDLWAFWGQYMSEGAEVKECLKFLLDEGYNFLAEEEDKRIWLDWALVRAVKPSPDSYISNSGNGWKWTGDAGRVVRQMKDDEWLPAALYGYMRFSDHCKDKIDFGREAPGNIKRTDCGLFEVSRLDQCSGNSKMLFGLEECDLPSCNIEQADCEVLLEMANRFSETRTSRGLPWLSDAIGVLKSALDDDGDNFDESAKSHAMLALVAIFCRLTAIKDYPLNSNGKVLLHKRVDMAFTEKYYQRNEKWWQWLMRDIVVADVAIRFPRFFTDHSHSGASSL